MESVRRRRGELHHCRTGYTEVPTGAAPDPLCRARGARRTPTTPTGGRQCLVKPVSTSWPKSWG